MKPKPIKAFCAVTPNGRLLPSTCSVDEGLCADACENYWENSQGDPHRHWCDLVEEGYRIVKVKIKVREK